jgi:hypothetical protein
MGATSITGVSGPGAAYSGIKGPGNNRNFYVPQISPHVVAAGEATLSGAGAATVTFPSALESGEENYVVILTPQAATVAYVNAKTEDADGYFASFDVVGAAADTVGWIVVKAGWGLDVTA